MKQTTALLLVKIGIFISMVTVVVIYVSGCGEREPGHVVTKIHVPAGTPSSDGGVHGEQWFIHCKNAKTNAIKSIEVKADEYTKTNVNDACDLNRGK